MAASLKYAQTAYKRVLKVGERETALEYGLPISTIQRYCRIARRCECTKPQAVPDDEYCHAGPERYDSVKEMIESMADDRPVLIIPDLHAPYHHPDAIEFLQWVQDSVIRDILVKLLIIQIMYMVQESLVDYILWMFFICIQNTSILH